MSVLIGKRPLIVSIALVYSEAERHNASRESSEDTSIAGMIVSAMAINVVHCDSVSTSPACKEGSVIANGAIMSSSVLVMMDVMVEAISVGTRSSLRLRAVEVM